MITKLQLSFLFLIVTVLFLGCTVTRDRNAVTRVNSKPTLSEQAYNYYIATHPIVEPKPVIIKGKDTTIYSTDTLIIDRVKDSLIKIACPSLNLDSLRKANTIVKYIDHYRVDTLPVLDTSCARKYNKSQYDNGVLTGEKTQLTAQVKQADKKAQIRLYWIIGLGLALAIAVFILLKNLFFKTKLK